MFRRQIIDDCLFIFGIILCDADYYKLYLVLDIRAKKKVNRKTVKENMFFCFSMFLKCEIGIGFRDT
mgnify:CR=1 FL=1